MPIAMSSATKAQPAGVSGIVSLEKVEEHIEKARDALLKKQKEDGHWCFELEADCTIPAEYILMMHYLDKIDEELEQKIAVYLRRRQNEEGGWPLYYGGSVDLSCTVKCYYALKLAGDDPEESHMLKARKAILQRGGAARSNVFTRIALAMFEQIPWRGVPFLPVEIMLFPKWFPLTLGKVSYWSRTVMVPLFILCSLRAKAKNPRGVHIRELFIVPPEEERNYHPVRSRLNWMVLQLERIGCRLEPFIPQGLRKQAIKKAQDWFLPRLNGTSGLGAIFPAMVNVYEAMLLLGYPEDDTRVATAREALERLLVIREDEAYCQPCVSPVWDTLLASCTLQEAGGEQAGESLDRALGWLKDRQLMDDTPGDWKAYNPDLPNGSWPFQYENDYYPDLDDTAFAAFAMHCQDEEKYGENIKRAAEWLAGMQSRNGGFAAFDADNTHYYLNEIPFADHGALLDPPTADVSARCLMLFGRLKGDHSKYRSQMEACLEYLFKEQEKDGSWFGRWGTNYIYGTWSVLMALREAGIPHDDPRIRRAVQFLKKTQRSDGGWGEDNDSYYPEYKLPGLGYNSTAVHTAWALLGLMSAGEVHSGAVARGIRFLMDKQAEDGHWYDAEFNAPGFPRVFYLKYHGYEKYFPLWALARYRNLVKM
jgi:squalene-hopene/tetraprenyl-beta-curcumene cyclase